jgi:PAS domain S-box-containing protein
MPRKSNPAAPINILVVEDMPGDADLIKAELDRSGFSGATYIRIETLEQYLQQIALVPDVILCDYALPTFGAPEALRVLHERRIDIPFIIVSGSIGEETAVEAIKNGADDYLLKDRLGRLGSAILQALEEKRLRDSAHRAEEDLRQSEFKYRSMFEHLPDAAYLCDAATGRIIDTNRRGERILELDRAGVLGSRLQQFVSASTGRSLLGAGESHSADAAPLCSIEILNGRGRALSFQATAIPVPIYKRRLVLVLFHEHGAAVSETRSA